MMGKVFCAPYALVVEVLSKGNKKMDWTRKFNLYAQFKAPHYWMVDPIEKTIFPGLEFFLKELWS